MNVYIIVVICSMISLLLLLGAPTKFMRFFGDLGIKLIIAAIILYGVNVTLGEFGIHIPINEFTIIFSGLLGVPGIAVLAATQIFLT